ncbi:MAG: site-2 protease family protein [Anaerolineales bacterium]|jgi:membrane-associated protease RseP (regulator of RpoE activity)
MLPDEDTTLTSIVRSVMTVEDVTEGDGKQNFLVRYQGKLNQDSAAAYDELSERMRPYNLTPLFRNEDGRHTILLMNGRVDPKPSNPWINLLMFVLTVLSVLYAGALYNYTGPEPDSVLQYLLTPLRHLDAGLSFAVSLMAILLAHEFGHYLAGRYHKTHVTLPYFLPFPISPFGTMGAFIQLKEPPKNKRVLLDIGIAGPLAGLVVAIPVLLLGLSLSTVNYIHVAPGQGIQLEGNSILYLLSKFIVFGQLLPMPETYGNLPPALYWLRYFFTGQPLPLGGLDVMMHPVAWAGWAGLLVTALNLIPAGQFDGGHIIYVLFGRKARFLMPFILVGLILLGLVWAGWWLWALLIFLLGRLYAEPLDQITPLDPRRRAVAFLGIVIFVLVFTPVPLIITAG